jgi:hypothetical protein
MKKLMFFFLVILNFSVFSEIKEFNGNLWGILTDGEKIFSLVYYKKYQKLQIIYPIEKETAPLIKFKSFYRYYQLLNDKIITLFDNNVLFYDTNLKLIKRLKLPKNESEYHFNYSLKLINPGKKSIIIIGEKSQRCFLLNNLELKELKNELVFDGNKIEFKNNIILINGYTTALKYKRFSSLVHFLFVLNNEFILVRNSLFDNSGRLLVELPFTFGVDDAILLENLHILFNPENIVIINKKGEMIKVIKEESTEILGNLNQDQVVLTINEQYLGLLSLKTLDLKKKDLGEEISSAVLLDNKLFYVPRNNYKVLKIRPIKDIFVE